MSRLQASIQGARELAWPVVAMSTTLIAVFIPLGFMSGLTGVLFLEFAFTLAATVVVSGIVALTLSPMMCSRILVSHKNGEQRPRFEQALDRFFDRLRDGYQRRLHGALNSLPVVLVFGLVILVSCYFLFVTSPSELEPQEDVGFIFSIAEGDSYGTLDNTDRNAEMLNRIPEEIPEADKLFVISGFQGTNSAGAGIVLAPWDERERTTKEVLDESVTPFMEQIPGLNVFAIIPPSLPTPGGGTPVQFVIGSTQPFEAIGEVAQEVMGRAMQSGRFIFMDTNLKIDRPRQTVKIDREKAALMGVDMQQLAADMGSMLAGAYAGRFALDNRSYRVIPQIQRTDRLNPDQLKDMYTRNREGELIPLSALITLEDSVQPRQLSGFQQLNAVTISGVPRPGVTLGEALGILEQAAAEVLPDGYSVDYSGQSRQYKSEGQQMVATFFFALLVIFLVLAAQFESFRNSIIILVTVPMSIAGALIFISLPLPFLASLNIYTQVGLLTLIGLIAKHGILIVEFANQLQMQGRSKREAIEEATAIRLRPILMTTASTVLAVIPLIIASGAGAASRQAMGQVIASGMAIGTAFTLFVVPAMYLALARDYHKEEESLPLEQTTQDSL